MSEALIKKLTINCPYCDEPAYQTRKHRIVTPTEIYTLRKCIMGHEFYSVESVPENQNEIVQLVRSLKDERQT